MNTSPKEIVLLSSGRSGSNMLLSMLAASQAIYPFGEIYKKNKQSNEFNYFLSVKLKEDLTQEQQSLIRDLADRSLLASPAQAHHLAHQAASVGNTESTSTKIVTSKLFIEHIFHRFTLISDVTPLIQDFCASQAVVLVNYRNNLLDTFISGQRARGENCWMNKGYALPTPCSTVKDYFAWRDWYVRTWALCFDLLEAFKLSPDRTTFVEYETLKSLPLNDAADSLSLSLFGYKASEEWKDALPHTITKKQSENNTLANDRIIFDDRDAAMKFEDDRLTQFLERTSASSGKYLREPTGAGLAQQSLFNA